MNIEDFKAALRRACDTNVKVQDALIKDFAAEIDGLVSQAKSADGADVELIEMTFALEIRRYGSELDKL
jgi:hypothetical protein